MSTKIRKHIYIEREQDAILKQLAHDTGMSETRIIREDIDRHVAEVGNPAQRQQAWARIEAFIAKRMEIGPVHDGRTWRREDLYDR
jgi:hypothetical protein